METTRVFMSGNSQAVRLPKGFQLDDDEVEIFRREAEIIIRPIPKNLARAFEQLPKMPEDFFANSRADSLPQERDFD